MTESQRQQLESIVSALIKTLGSMEASKADQVVAEVVKTIQTDVLGKKGNLVKDFDIFVDYTNRGGERRFGYKWVDDEVN